jgi:hypothetical protein
MYLFRYQVDNIEWQIYTKTESTESHVELNVLGWLTLDLGRYV